MKLTLCIIVCHLLSNFSFGQDRPNFNDSIITVSRIMKDVSYFWKLDSLANNGYRSCAKQKILRAKLDKISKSFLVEKLGKPSSISEDYSGNLIYLYYTFDILEMPKDFDAPSSTRYIAFYFRKNEDFVALINQGDNDR